MELRRGVVAGGDDEDRPEEPRASRGRVLRGHAGAGERVVVAGAQHELVPTSRAGLPPPKKRPNGGAPPAPAEG